MEKTCLRLELINDDIVVAIKELNEAFECLRAKDRIGECNAIVDDFSSRETEKGGKIIGNQFDPFNVQAVGRFDIPGWVDNDFDCVGNENAENNK